MKKSNVESLVYEIVDPIIDGLNMELVDVEYIKEGPHMYLRVYIDKIGGVTLDDCKNVSEKLSEELDVKDPISDNYFLEVSSPGLDRPLKNDSDLKRSIGKDVELNLYKAIDGDKKLIGKLLKYDDEKIYIEDTDNSEKAVDRSVISKVNLAVNF